MSVPNNVQKLRWPAKVLDLNPIDHVYFHRHMLSMSTRYLAVDATPGGCTKC